jgi:hypothetical protein
LRISSCTPSASSSAITRRLTNCFDSASRFAAAVKLWASTVATKIRMSSSCILVVHLIETVFPISIRL